MTSVYTRVGRQKKAQHTQGRNYTGLSLHEKTQLIHYQKVIKNGFCEHERYWESRPECNPNNGGCGICVSGKEFYERGIRI